MIDEIALGLAEEHPEADPDEIRVCATLRHQSSMLLAHAALDRRRFGQDSVVMDYFDTLSAAQLSLPTAGRSGVPRNLRNRFPGSSIAAHACIRPRTRGGPWAGRLGSSGGSSGGSR